MSALSESNSLGAPPGFSPTPHGDAMGNGIEMQTRPFIPDTSSPIKMGATLVSPSMNSSESESYLDSLLQPPNREIPTTTGPSAVVTKFSPLSPRIANESSLFESAPELSPEQRQDDIESMGQPAIVEQPSNNMIPVDEINIKLSAYKASGFGNIVKMEISEPTVEVPHIENEIPGEIINKTNQSEILGKITSKFDNTKFAEGFAFDPNKEMKYKTSSLAGKVTTAREAWAALSSWALKHKSDDKYPMVIEFMEWLTKRVGTEWRVEDFNGQNAHDLYRSIIKPEIFNTIKSVSAKQTIYNATDDKSTIISKLDALKEELRKGNSITDNQRMDIEDAKKEIKNGDATESLLKGILKNIADLNSKHLKDGILYAPNRLFGVSKDAFRRNELKNFIVKKRMFGGKTQRCGFKGGARKTKKSKSGRKTRRCRK
jgi:hypothetical protein